MAHVFKPGDRVVIVKSRHAHRIGVIATVVSGLLDSTCSGRSHPHQCWCEFGNPKVHDLDLLTDTPGEAVAYPPSHLEPYLPDGHEKAEWTDELRRWCAPKVPA